MAKKLSRRMALAALAAALTSPAWAADRPADWDKVIAAAKQEGKLVVYNGTNFQVVRKIGQRFEAAYGVPVDVLDGRASEIRERIRSEQASGRSIGDTTYSGATTIGMQTSEGRLREHGPLPNAGRIAAPLKDNGTFIPANVGGFAILINTTLVPPAQEPKTWKDLTDPKWQGKILSDDPRAAGGGEVWFEATVEKFGRGFHEKMAAQKPVFSRSFADNQRRIARGEYPIYIPLNLSEVPGLKGLPIKAVIPAEGIPYVPFGPAILKDPPHPNAARLFLDYVLSDEAQLIFANEGFRPSAKGMDSKVPAELRPLLIESKLLGSTNPLKLDEMLKMATEIYK